MMKELFLIAIGIGLGYTVTQSKTIQVNSNLKRTEYSDIFLERYQIGWTYDRYTTPQKYHLGINWAIVSGGPPPRNWLSWMRNIV